MFLRFERFFVQFCARSEFLGVFDKTQNKKFKNTFFLHNKTQKKNTKEAFDITEFKRN